MDYRTGGNETSLLEGTHRILGSLGPRGKGAVTPQETEAHVSAGVGESPEEVWVGSGLSHGWWYWQLQSWELPTGGNPTGGCH